MRGKLVLFLAAAAVFAASPVEAQLLSTGPGPITSFPRDSFYGPSQRVAVATPVTITSFGFWGRTYGTLDMKFVIFDGSGSTLLFSQVVPGMNVTAPQLILSDPLSFSLLAGNTYIFGFIGNGGLRSFDFEFFFPSVAISQNGLTTGGNSNFGPYSNPQWDGEGGVVTMAIELRGSTVPEPASLALLATGLLGVCATARRG